MGMLMHYHPMQVAYLGLLIYAFVVTLIVGGLTR